MSKENLIPGGAITNCTGCCTKCGRHFASQRAFDRHRKGEYEVTTERGKVLKENTRYCANPDNVEGLIGYWGKCPRESGHEVTLWKVAHES
jgi:hypothetical protein